MYSILLDLFKKTDIKKTKRLNPLLRAVYSTMCFPLFQISAGLGRRYIYHRAYDGNSCYLHIASPAL